MALYPSLEDMKLDNMYRAQTAHQPQSLYNTPTQILPPPSSIPSASDSTVYPSLGDYMGLELSPQVIALNMPEYQLQPQRVTGVVSNVVAPLSQQSATLAKATVTQCIRQVVLCKDKNGRVGLRLHTVNSGVFVAFVEANCPAALAGLRFGDQVLEINNVSLAGLSMDKCHDLIKRAPVNGIRMSVRDRPFERTVTLHKDSLGRVGFHFKDGKIVSLVKDSSAARNGLLTEHQLVEVNTQNVAGMSDRDISRVIEQSPSVVNVTIIPHYIYKHMISKMSNSLFREMDRSPAV